MKYVCCSISCFMCLNTKHCDNKYRTYVSISVTLKVPNYTNFQILQD